MSKKLLAAGVVLALVAAVLVGVGAQSASAQTMSLCQTVDALVAAGVIAPDKVAAAKAAAGCSAATASVSFTRDLTVGSTGADVTALQTMLGVTPATGYFGAITKAAVVAYQTSKGIAPAAGYVGPLTRASLNASVVVVPPVVTPGTTPSSSSLSGADGNIADVNMLSQYSNEEVGDGQNNVKVAGFEVEASNDGDIQLKSIKLAFNPAGNTGSDHLDDYIDGVSIWMGSTKVGSADVSDFTEDSAGTSTRTISLNNAVVKAEQTVKFYISVDSVNNLDSGDITGDSWTVDIVNIRFEDGSGVTTTDDSTGDIAGTAGTAINFVSFSTAADTELKISTDSSTPDAGIVMVDDTDNTDGVVLLKGKLKLDGTSDVVIDELPITLATGTSNGSGATDVDEITGNLTLIIDGEEYSESVSTALATAATITFDNLNFAMSAGDTVYFEIRADINDIETGLFEEGDSINATLTSTNRSHIDVENEEGDQLADSEKSGAATGEDQEFRTQGIAVSLVSTDAVVTAGSSATDDAVTFTIKFKVTAVGGDVYLPTTAVAGDGYTYVVDDSGTATTGGVSAVIVNNTDTTVTAGQNWLIEDGASETLTLTVARVQGPVDAGLYRAALTAIGWDDDDTGAVAPDNSYTSNLDSFKTAYVSIN